MAPVDRERAPTRTGFLVVLLILVLLFGGYLGGARGAGGSVITLMSTLSALYMLNRLPDPWW